MTERRQYKNPPIQEAICEIRFDQEVEWDLAVPAKLQSAFGADYGGQPVQELGGGIQYEPGVTALRLQAPRLRIRFPTEDGRQIVTTSPGLLVVHVLSPYEGWEAFAERIKSAFAGFVGASSPGGVRRIGMRYINRFPVTDDLVMLTDLFVAPPGMPEELDLTMREFLFRATADYDDDQNVHLIQTFASAEDDGEASIVLDLDVYQEWSDGHLDHNDVPGAVEALRVRERKAFEALITDKAREAFDAE